MMHLKFLAISDTHLGDETSLLCFPQGRHHLWKVLKQLLSRGEDSIVVDELILVGDVVDRTLSSTAHIITHTNAFIQTLGSVLDVRKLVYLPGNHDHALWTNYCKRRYGTSVGSTTPSGDVIVNKGTVDKAHSTSAAELLSVLFGYPDGHGWRTIVNDKKLDLVIANPIYASQLAGRSYLFTHGTHFRPWDVTSPKWLKEVFDHLEVDQLLGRLEVDCECDVKKATNLTDLEAIVAPFVDSLWPSSQDSPSSYSDQLWYLLSAISGKLTHKRAAPFEHSILTWQQLMSLTDDELIRQLTPEYTSAMSSLASLPTYQNKSIDACNRYFLHHALKALRASGLPAGHVTMVFGDNHRGGWGRLPGIAGGEVRIYNTGGWVVYNKDHHPPCHVFAVDEKGTEYLIDVSFKDVCVGNSTLLDVASEDAENKQKTGSKIMRLVLRFLENRE